MWSYYGSKSMLINLYPRPQFNKIIEPFAGTARYALKYFEHDITIVDKYDVVIKIWKWLQQCSPKDILSLPKTYTGLDLRTLNLSDGELLFLQMNAGISSLSPRNKVSKFSAEQNGRKNKYKLVSDSLYKIKHWNIIHGDYKDLNNVEATWFIDPPYQFGGQAYVENKIDFGYLSNWCQERLGQTIVCENMKADWLPFVPIKKIRSIASTPTIEAIWTNTNTHFNNIQQSLNL
jgi:site-specific DNA-adenine methylase